jgi:hypothetical protein
MALNPRELTDGLAIPFQSEPSEPLDDRGHRRFRRAFAIGVFDAQQEGSAVAARVEPIEQSRPRAADMQKAGRRGREARHNFRHRPDRFQY